MNKKRIVLTGYAFALPLTILCFCLFTVHGKGTGESEYLAGYPLVYYESCGTSACINFSYPAGLLDLLCYFIPVTGVVFITRKLFARITLSNVQFTLLSMLCWLPALTIVFLWGFQHVLIADRYWGFLPYEYNNEPLLFWLFTPWN